ncbi:MAG: phosphatidylinositol mannoside acyltransferase, partial [Acidimicrobiales bacterium]
MNRTVTAYKAAASITRVLPRPLANLLGRGGALGASALMDDERLIIERNLRRVYGPDYRGLPLRRSVQAVLDNYARYWVESFRLPGTSPEELDAGMSFDGFHRIEHA